MSSFQLKNPLTIKARFPLLLPIFLDLRALTHTLQNSTSFLGKAKEDGGGQYLSGISGYSEEETKENETVKIINYGIPL